MSCFGLYLIPTLTYCLTTCNTLVHPFGGKKGQQTWVSEGRYSTRTLTGVDVDVRRRKTTGLASLLGDQLYYHSPLYHTH